MFYFAWEHKICLLAAVAWCEVRPHQEYYIYMYRNWRKSRPEVDGSSGRGRLEVALTSLWDFGAGQRVPVGHPLDQIKPGRLGATHTEWFPVCLAFLFFFFFFNYLPLNPVNTVVLRLDKGDYPDFGHCISGRIFFSRVNFLCFLFQYPFHPRVTAVARKRPQSFCQKRRWQVTAKHAYTLRMWLCMKWHGAWLYGVHRTRRDGSSFMWHQPCQRCKYTTSVDIQKLTHYKSKASHSCRITCQRSDSAWERRIALYKSDQ